jgi:hypothetical protein
MSRLEDPLRHRTLRATGDSVLWADLILSLLGDSNVSPRTQTSKLLGLTGVVNQICLTFDGRPLLRT